MACATLAGMETAPWGIHGVVLAILAGIGLAVTVIDRLTPSRGGWISLRGVASLFVWIVLGSYAVASTLTFALSPFWGPVAGYLAALPLLAAAWGAFRGLERCKTRRLYERQKAEIGSRLELLSWSPETPGPGRLRLRAEIRARKDLLVRFHGMGLDAARNPVLLDDRQEPVRVKADETARLELEISFTPDRPMADHVLEFWTWTGVDEEGGPSQGVLSYERVDAELQDGPCLLRRPLPPARPT
jgi:hypothetical protein